jgi:hypothetical protein
MYLSEKQKVTLQLFYLFILGQQVGIAAIFHAYTFLFILLVIALPLDV